MQSLRNYTDLQLNLQLVIELVQTTYFNKLEVSRLDSRLSLFIIISLSKLYQVSILSTSSPSFPSGMEESTLLEVMLMIGLMGGSGLEVGKGTPFDVCVLGLAPS